MDTKNNDTKCASNKNYPTAKRHTAKYPYDRQSVKQNVPLRKVLRRKVRSGGQIEGLVSASQVTEDSQVRALTDYVLLFCVPLIKNESGIFCDESWHVAQIHV